MFRALAIALPLALLAAPLTACAGPSLEETIPVSRGGTLVIELERGSVEISSHDADEVRIEARARGWDSGRFEFELSRDGNDVQLVGEVRLLAILLLDLDVRVRAWVPREYSVELHTSRGSVEVSEIRGDVEVTSSRGGVRIADVVGEASLKTSRGEVHVRGLSGNLAVFASRAEIDVAGVSGSVVAETDRAAIRVVGVGGDLRLRTNRSPIEVEDAEGEIDVESNRAPITVRNAPGRVRARTNRAPISASFANDPAGELETNRGSIEVQVRKQARFDLDAETHRGRVEISDALSLEGDRGREQVTARLNGGGERLRLRTNRGDIRVSAD